MTVYVVSGNEIEIGEFDSFEGDTVSYFGEDNVLRREHRRNVFFSEIRARRHLLRSLGVFRPVLNGAS